MEIHDLFITCPYGSLKNQQQPKKINKISFLDSDFWNFLNQSIIIEIVSCYTCYMRKMN